MPASLEGLLITAVKHCLETNNYFFFDRFKLLNKLLNNALYWTAKQCTLTLHTALPRPFLPT